MHQYLNQIINKRALFFFNIAKQIIIKQIQESLFSCQFNIQFEFNQFVANFTSQKKKHQMSILQDNFKKLIQYLNESFKRLNQDSGIKPPQNPLNLAQHIINHYQKSIENLNKKLNDQKATLLKSSQQNKQSSTDKFLKGSLSSENSKSKQKKLFDNHKIAFQSIFDKKSSSESYGFNFKQEPKSIIKKYQLSIEKNESNKQIIEEAQKTSIQLMQQNLILKAKIRSQQKNIKHLYQRMQIYFFQSNNTQELESQLQKQKVQSFLKQNEINQLKKDNKKLKNTIQSLESQIKKLNDQYQKFCKRSDQVVQQLTTEIFQTQNQNNELKIHIQQMKQKIQQMEQKIQRDLQQYRKTVQDLQRNFDIDIKRSLMSQLGQQTRKLVQQNGQKQKQINFYKNKERIVRQKLDICAYYLGKWIDYPKLDSQIFQEWYQKARKYLKQYQHSSLSYPTQRWIIQQKKINQKLLFK